MVHAARHIDETALAKNLASIFQITTHEACDVARRLPVDEHAELVVYCYSRGHLRDKGASDGSCVRTRGPCTKVQQRDRGEPFRTGSRVRFKSAQTRELQ
jgi:hypothetical protein